MNPRGACAVGQAFIRNWTGFKSHPGPARANNVGIAGERKARDAVLARKNNTRPRKKGMELSAPELRARPNERISDVSGTLRLGRAEIDPGNEGSGNRKPVQKAEALAQCRRAAPAGPNPALGGAFLRQHRKHREQDS